MLASNSKLFHLDSGEKLFIIISLIIFCDLPMLLALFFASLQTTKKATILYRDKAIKYVYLKKMLLLFLYHGKINYSASHKEPNEIALELWLRFCE
jgi:hypothetical protein